MNKRKRFSPIVLTVSKAGDRRYDPACAERARGALKQFVDSLGGNGLEAARQLGTHQSTLWRNLQEDRQPSLNILIRLAKKTHRTVDEILGLARPTSAEVRLSDSSLMRAAKMIASEVARELRDESGPSRPGNKGSGRRRGSSMPPKA